jgi:hypothetical protein
MLLLKAKVPSMPKFPSQVAINLKIGFSASPVVASFIHPLPELKSSCKGVNSIMCLSSLKTKETKKKQEQKIVGIRRRNHKRMEESKN